MAHILNNGNVSDIMGKSGKDWKKDHRNGYRKQRKQTVEDEQRQHIIPMDDADDEFEEHYDEVA